MCVAVDIQLLSFVAKKSSTEKAAISWLWLVSHACFKDARNPKIDIGAPGSKKRTHRRPNCIDQM